MPPLRTPSLRCFGAPALLDAAPDGSEVVVLGPGKPLLLLAYLEANPDGADREVLATLGWGNSTDTHARGSLRQALFRLRKVLGPEAIATEGPVVRLLQHLPSDRSRFLEALAARDADAACAAYGGPYLRGIDSADPDDLGRWEVAERRRYELLWVDAALRQGDAALQRAEADTAARAAEAVLRAVPDNLAAWELLLGALATGRAGDPDDALARFRVAIETGVFAGELQARAVTLQRLHGRDASGGGTTPPRGSGDFPLIGRQALLDRLMALADRSSGRAGATVVVLEGSAGMGKSRLLRECAARREAQQAAVVQVLAPASERNVPWSLAVRVVRALITRPGAGGVHPESLRTLVALDPSLARRFPGAGAASPDLRAADPLTAALVDLVSATVDEAPYLLMVDDLHHGDRDSLQLLEAAWHELASGGVPLIGATRPRQRHLPTSWTYWQVPPFDRTTVETLLQSVMVGLPEASVPAVAETMMMISGGTPLYLRRTMQLLVGDGILRHLPDGRLEVPEASALMAALPTLSLHRDPSFPQEPRSRELLGYLTVAEEPVGLEELSDALHPASVEELDRLLERLSVAGWVHRVGGGDLAQIAHAVIAEQAETVAGSEVMRELSLRRARWLVRHGEGIGAVRQAVAVFHRHGRLDAALHAARSVRDRTGQRMPGLADLITPASASTLFRWRVRLATTRTGRLVAPLTLLTLTGALVGFDWFMRRPAELRLENVPLIEPAPPSAKLNNGRWDINDQPPIFSVRDRRGRITRLLDGKAIEARVVTGGATFEKSWESTVNEGTVAATGHRLFVARDALMDTDSAVAIFSIGTLESRPIVLFRPFRHFAITVIGGTLAGQTLTSERPTIRVARGSLIEGNPLVRYKTPSAPIIWALGESSTFGLTTPDTATVATLHANATDAYITFRVSRRAPDRPGTYWLVWATAAEPSAGWIFSRTNWRCGTPIWGDGDDLLAILGDTLSTIWGGGAIGGTRRLCQPEFPDALPIRTPAAAVQVIVE